MEAKTKKKVKKEKPLSLKMTAGMSLHVNRNYLTNYHFMLRASLFDTFGFEKEDADKMLAYKVDSRGKLRLGSPSTLNDAKCERVFELWQNDKYESEIPRLRAVSSAVVTIQGKRAASKVAAKYLPLLERLEKIPGGEWQVNVDNPTRALRFVLNGKTEALLMPVRV